MTDEKRSPAPDGEDPGVTTWGDGEAVTSADEVAGDLRTETGEAARAETGQDGMLEDSRPKP
jgi:hypothetical protein